MVQLGQIGVTIVVSTFVREEREIVCSIFTSRASRARKQRKPGLSLNLEASETIPRDHKASALL